MEEEGVITMEVVAGVVVDTTTITMEEGVGVTTGIIITIITGASTMEVDPFTGQ